MLPILPRPLPENSAIAAALLGLNCVELYAVGGGLAIATVILAGLGIASLLGLLESGLAAALIGGSALVALLGWIDDVTDLPVGVVTFTVVIPRLSTAAVAHGARPRTVGRRLAARVERRGAIGLVVQTLVVEARTG